MFKLTGWICIFFFISACKKDTALNNTGLPSPTADYEITVATKWSSPQFTVPSGAHITTLTGMVHATDTFLWHNAPATLGLENVAEIGVNTVMLMELDSIIQRGKAISRFAVPPPVINDSVNFQLTFTTSFPAISFASMIAPSPDWFIGLDNYSLLQQNIWVNEVTLDLYVYDAGTEDGDVFGYNNPPTVPAQPVSLLTAANATVLANGNPGLAAIATIRFRKI